MASMGVTQNEVDILVRKVKAGGMLNKTLQAICSNEGLKQTGIKADLQQRIIDRLNDHYVRLQWPLFNRLKGMIENPHSLQQGGSQYASMTNSASPAASVIPGAYLGLSSTGYNMGGGANNYRPGGGHQSLEFKPSPFYTIQQQLGQTKECQVMTAHRHTVSMAVKTNDHPILSRVLIDPSLRVMVFCSSENHGRQDVAFPHQSEIKVNTGEVKANLRGLKNKPGSTRPVDITKELRLKVPTYSNNVELTYALTTKASGSPQKFYLLLYVVKVVPVVDLVKKLENGQRITKDSVISDMVSKSRDADIVTTATVLSLKCPLSTLRIDLPCRSIACRHVQCFDATSYLQLQEQGPTWMCPICNNAAPFETLAVDEYVKDILKNTSRSVDQVTIQPDGRWELHAKQENKSRFNGNTSQVTGGSDDDDDLIEITKSGDSVRMGTPRAYGTPLGGLAQKIRDQSSSAPPGSSGSNASGKRSISAVIDLTSSGDEDDEPLLPPTKRQNSVYGQPSVPVYRPIPPGINGYTPRP